MLPDVFSRSSFGPSGATLKSSSPEIEELRLSITGCMAMLVALGIGRFAYPPLIPPLIHQHWFTAGQAHAFAALNLAGYLFGSLIAPGLARRVSVPFLIRLSMLCTGFSFAAFVVPAGFLWGALWRFSSGVTGALVMIYVPPLVLGQIRPHRRGWATGIIFTGVGAGIIIAGLLVPALLKLGVEAAWMSLGAASFLMTAVVWKSIGATDHAPMSAYFEPIRLNERDRVQLILLGISYCCYAAGFIPHTIFYVDYIARELLKGSATASSYWIMFGAAALIGAPLGGLAAHRFGFRISLVLGYALLGAGVGSLLLSRAEWPLAVSSIFVGTSFPALTALTAGRITELVPAAARKRIWSWFTLSFSATYAAAGFAYTGVLAHYGSYRMLFGWSTGLLSAGFALSFLAASISNTKPLVD